MANIKLILLDFDGTLVDTRRANACAYIETLSEVGITLTEKEYLDKYYGVRCIEFMRMLGFEDSSKIAELRQRKVKLYPKYFDTVKLNTELWGWCCMMRKMGAKVWIVSTGHADNIRNVMRYLNLEDGIDGIITGDDVEHSKPAPDPFLEAMRRESVTPAETIIFEDSAVGIEAARRTGAPYVVIRMD
ncbi:MAG: HAD-IA family hydrolase [Alistipes sp.]|nr:HAD-IA family hydrolase [Alistipes sp.]